MTDIISQIDDNVQIVFEKSNGVNILQDVINLTKEEYAALSHVQLENIKQTRFDQWLAFMNAPPLKEEI